MIKLSFGYLVIQAVIVMESIIKKNMIDYSEEQVLLKKNQCGFCKGKAWSYVSIHIIYLNSPRDPKQKKQ